MRDLCVEVFSFHLLLGYPESIPGWVLPVQRVGPDLNTRRDLDPAGNKATGTRVPARFEKPRFTPVHLSSMISLED